MPRVKRQIEQTKEIDKHSLKARGILISAARTFRGHGFATASMAQIAKDLGMTKSNLYYYFKSKEEILFASHVHLMEELARLSASIDCDEEPEQQIRWLTEGFIHIIVDEFHASALTQNVRGMTPEHQEQIIKMRDSFESRFRSIIQRGIDIGRFRSVDVKLISFAVFGSINWIQRWHRNDGPSDSDTIARQFADFVIAGLMLV